MENNQIQKQKRPGLKSYINNPLVMEKFKKLLDTNADRFVQALLSLNNEKLSKCTPETVLGSALKAASLNLSIDPNMGQAWIIPFRNHGVLEAQFQIGYKGYIQMAQRSGEYLRLTCTPIDKAWFKSWDPVKEELDYDSSIEKTGEVVGYSGYFKLRNGFEKQVYWTKQEIIDHATKYSQSYRKNQGPWKDDFDGMALKTVIKLMINKWGILSIEMQSAIEADSAVIKSDGHNESIRYEDNKVEPADIPNIFMDAEYVEEKEEETDESEQQ